MTRAIAPRESLGRSVGRPAGVSMCVHERMSASTPRVSCSDIPANAKALTASSSARASGRMGATERQERRRIGHRIRLYLVRIVRKCSAFASGIGLALRTRAPARRRDAHMGRERPRLATSGPQLRRWGGVAHAPSLLRHMCWGAPRAAQTAARPHCSAGAKIEGSQGLAAAGGGDAHTSGVTRDDVRRSVRANRALEMRPRPRPL